MEAIKNNEEKKTRALALEKELSKKLEKQNLDLKDQLRREQKNAENARIQAAQANLKAEGAKEGVSAMKGENKELRKKLETAIKETALFDKKAAVAEARLEAFMEKTSR